AQTRSTAVAAVAREASPATVTPAAAHATATIALRKREDIQRPSLRRVLRQIGHRGDEAERRGRIRGREVAGDDGAGPSAHAGEYGDVLLAVRAFVRDRLSDDSGTGLELPQLLAAARVDRLEPPVHRSVEGDVAG